MLIYVQLYTYSIYNCKAYKFEPHFEKIGDDITKEKLNIIFSNMTKWYKNYDPNTMYAAVYKDIAFDKNHLVWENGKYINKSLINKIGG